MYGGRNLPISGATSPLVPSGSVRPSRDATTGVMVTSTVSGTTWIEELPTAWIFRSNVTAYSPSRPVVFTVYFMVAGPPAEVAVAVPALQPADIPTFVPAGSPGTPAFSPTLTPVL